MTFVYCLPTSLKLNTTIIVCIYTPPFPHHLDSHEAHLRHTIIA